MPIMTGQIYAINKINKMDVSVNEKIKLLNEIKLDSPSRRNCLGCMGKRLAAEKLLSQMIEFEIAKLKGEA